MTNEEAFDPKEGKLISEILNKLTSNKPDFSDIKEVMTTFRSESLFVKLKESLAKIERLVPSKNHAVLGGVSAALRQFLISKTRQYVNDVLDFRSLAFVTFKQFEKVYFDYLSRYEQVNSSQLRQFLTQKLDELTQLSVYETSKRSRFVAIYLAILNSKWSDSLIQPSILSLKQVISQCGNKLNPYLMTYYKNLHNLLNNYVNWCDRPLKTKGRIYWVSQIN